MKKRKILYISGTRADYGLLKPTLLAIKNHPKLQVEVASCGMHLMSEFGKTIKEIKSDGFKNYSLDVSFNGDDNAATVEFVGKFLLSILKKIKRHMPDIILVQGDRPEALAGAIAGVYLGIPVAHTHGGDVTLTSDEITRHAVTKMAHIHFPATKKSAERIIKMGEDKWRVCFVGSPGLDSVLSKKLASIKEIAKKYKLDISKPVILVIQHPASKTEPKEAGRQMRQTLEALRVLAHQAIVIYPNADPGGREIIRAIEEYRKYPFIKIYKNIPHDDYLGLMRAAKTLVGNSSSGLVEAPSFKLPVVNIGERELGRERACNVIDVGYDKKQIKMAIEKAIYDKSFKEKITRCKNPYGDGKTGPRITKILSQIKIDKKLLQKQICY